MNKPLSTSRRVSSRPPVRRIGVLGVGIMGLAMAANLVKAGFEVYGYDPNPQARKRLKAAGGTSLKNASVLASNVDVIICALPSPKALHEAVQHIASCGHRQLVVMETSTLDVADKKAARDILKAQSIVMLDCPLSGTGAQAVLKDLTVYASGPRSVIRQMAPVFDGFAKNCFDLGAFGNGMKMKLMANLLVAVHNVATAEALLLGQKWGIAPSRAVQVLSDGAGGSRMLQIRGPLMADEGWKTPTMKVAIWQKDMALIAEALANAQVPAPLFSASVPVYNAAMALGHGDHDTASVFNVLLRMSSSP
ncbi:NAD(P)-dependent oxidoreductase [Limnohabitans sp.]|jgi:3-hydroxyisobutyrate dehydrogenase-like beta-hydroxyacid dehydrogenase|uniref:NAD(P)-dependent oxidoreductase n=1 Tax=Limnohabitans sp. TaxID=1907725 RepID=UPI0039BD0630|nr:NAD(P)-dependent oxidoreductase [Comamonadaceae bacterium]